MKAKINRLNAKAIIPTKGSGLAAGMDMYANCDADIIIEPGETKKIGTGIAIAPPHGYFCAIFARSGLATNEGLRPANCVGVCDGDYRGEYIVALHNDSGSKRTVKCGERIAQLVFLPYINVEFEESSLDVTERGHGGFGSTGRGTE